MAGPWGGAAGTGGCRRFGVRGFGGLGYTGIMENKMETTIYRVYLENRNPEQKVGSDSRIRVSETC